MDKKFAYENSHSFPAKIVSIGNLGYNVITSGGSVIKGVTSNMIWEVGFWVTVVKSRDSYTIIGTAATGPESVYNPS